MKRVNKRIVVSLLITEVAKYFINTNDTKYNQN